MAAPKGNNFNPNGRPKGSISETTKLMISVKETVLEAFHELQKDKKVNLIAWGKENPTAFYNIAAKLIPTEIKANVQTTSIPINKWLSENPIQIKAIDEPNTES